MWQKQYETVCYTRSGYHLRGDCYKCLEADESVHSHRSLFDNSCGICWCLYFLSMVLRNIPLGIAYAIWSGAGIVLVALVGWLVFKQQLDVPAIIGICMIIGGVLVINLFSGSVEH